MNPGFTFTSCVTLCKLLNFTMLQFPHLQHGVNSTQNPQVAVQMKVVHMCVKQLGVCWAHVSTMSVLAIPVLPIAVLTLQVAASTSQAFKPPLCHISLPTNFSLWRSKCRGESRLTPTPQSLIRLLTCKVLSSPKPFPPASKQSFSISDGHSAICTCSYKMYIVWCVLLID